MREYQRLVLNGKCHDGCSLSIAKLGDEGAALVHRDIEDGLSDKSTAQNAVERGAHLTYGSVNRHRKRHLTATRDMVEDSALGELTEIEALDVALKQGQKNMHNWKMTPSEWMKALELKMKLTEGTVFDGFMSAIASASQEALEPDEGTTREGVRPGGVEGTAEPAESVREALPEGQPTSRSSAMARRESPGDKHARTGEPVGQDVRHRDEAHPEERVQVGIGADDSEGVDAGSVPDGQHGSVL